MDNLGIQVEVYFASEINEEAMLVSEMNYGPRVTYIGDVTKLDSEKVDYTSSIHDISMTNPRSSDI